LVLLHGLFGSWDNFQGEMKAFSARFRVIAPDLRNHGRSPHSDEFSYAALAADVEDLLRRQGIASARLVGHSMGGKAAMHLALHRPALVDKLAVVDIAPRAYARHHDEIFGALLSLDLAAFSSRTGVVDALAARIPSLTVRQFLAKNLSSESGRLRWRIPLEVLHDRYEETLKPQDGPPFGKPALFLRGEKSDYVRGEDASEIRRLFPNARLAAIPQAGHWVHAENPAAFQEALLDFLTD
jgi:esterase